MTDRENKEARGTMSKKTIKTLDEVCVHLTDIQTELQDIQEKLDIILRNMGKDYYE